MNQNLGFPKMPSMVILAVVTTCVIGVGGIYLWEESSKSEIQTQLNTVKEELNTKLAEQSKKTDELIKELGNLRNPPLPNKYVKIISPKGDENLCLGDNFSIKWESNGLSAITLMIHPANAKYPQFPLGTFPSSYNETGTKDGSGLVVWKVGETTGGAKIQTDTTYKISAGYLTQTGSLENTVDSDGAFSILTCKG